MKKLLLSIIICFALFSTVKAQTSGGPDAYGYTWRSTGDPNAPTFNWIDLTTNPEAILVTGLLDDNVVGPFALNTPFHYYWYDVNSIYIASNGYIGFTNGSIASGATGFPTIPDPSGVNDYMGAFLTDLIFTGAGNIGKCYLYQSLAGDSIVISYVDVPFWENTPLSWTGANSFQIILNNADSSIMFQYLVQNGTSPSPSANPIEIGIENNSGTIGLEYSQAIYPTPNTAVKYYYPATTTLQIDDASTNWIENSNNAGLFLSKDGAPFNMMANIKNTGNSALAGFNVQADVKAANNAIKVRDTQVIAALAAGANQVVNFADPFLLTTAAGTYRLSVTTLLGGDATPSNNQRVLELQVVDTTLSAIELAYDNGVESGNGGVGWSGGDGGCAMYFVPPFYPCDLTQVKAWIVADANNVGYNMMVYADDGVNGAPLTLLDSVNVAAGTFATGGFVTTTLSAPISITSGGFYVLWYMGGDGVALGQNAVLPVSYRAYEILGGSSPSNFSPYRDNGNADLMIRAVIQKVVGLNEIKAGELFSQFYPNPAIDISTINYDLGNISGKTATLEVFNIAGKLVHSEVIGSAKGQLNINVKNFATGMYVCNFTAGDTKVNRKLTVIK